MVRRKVEANECHFFIYSGPDGRRASRDMEGGKMGEFRPSQLFLFYPAKEEARKG